MEYVSKLNNGLISADIGCPFKERNSIGVRCNFECPEPEDGLINCAFARLDDNNYRHLHNRSMYEAAKIGDFTHIKDNNN